MSITPESETKMIEELVNADSKKDVLMASTKLRAAALLIKPSDERPVTGS